MRIASALAAASLALFATACTERQEARVEADTAEGQQELSEARRTATATADRDLSEIDASIASLERASQNATAETREAYNESLNRLRTRRTELRADMDRYATATDNEFDDLEGRVGRGRMELRRDVGDARLRLAQNREEFAAAARERLADLDREIADVERGTANATAEARGKSAEAAAELRTERQQLGARVDAVGQATEAQFAELRDDVAGGFSRFGQNVRAAVDRLDGRAGDGRASE